MRKAPGSREKSSRFKQPSALVELRSALRGLVLLRCAMVVETVQIELSPPFSTNFSTVQSLSLEQVSSALLGRELPLGEAFANIYRVLPRVIRWR